MSNSIVSSIRLVAHNLSFFLPPKNFLDGIQRSISFASDISFQTFPILLLPSGLMIILSGNQPLQTPKMMAKIRRKKKEKKKTLNTQKLFSLLRIFFFLPFWFNWMSLRESERAAHLSGKMRQSVERVSGVATCTCRRIESVGLKRRPWIFPMWTMKNSEKKNEICAHSTVHVWKAFLVRTLDAEEESERRFSNRKKKFRVIKKVWINKRTRRKDGGPDVVYHLSFRWSINSSTHHSPWSPLCHGQLQDNCKSGHDGPWLRCFVNKAAIAGQSGLVLIRPRSNFEISMAYDQFITSRARHFQSGYRSFDRDVPSFL